MRLRYIISIILIVSINVVTSVNDTCKCSPKEAWLDVMVLIDSSMAMGHTGINQASAFVLASLDHLSIGQAERNQTRVGVITFSRTATLRAPLDAFKSNDDWLSAPFPYEGEEMADIEAAIQIATEHFGGMGRDNRRKVILLLSSAYTGGEFDPTEAAAAFREDGGIIITVEYAQKDGLSVPELCALASPGYCLSNNDAINTQKVVELLCRANCFCRANTVPYGVTADGIPSADCLIPVPLPTTQRLAQRTCHSSSASLVRVDADSQMRALSSAFPSKTPFWIGIQRKNNHTIWSDGSPVTYSRWAPGQPGVGDCVYMYQYAGFHFGWKADDCSNDHDYVCQTPACSSAHYCP